MQRRGLPALSGSGILGIQASLTTTRQEAVMRRPKHQMTNGEDLFVGIDLHKQRWHVTIRTRDVELFSASIPGTWESLHRVLTRYSGHALKPDILGSGFMTAWGDTASPA